ncbi:Lrp/AsnC ligand binding domain-containing protein [Falsirhodobacter sp. 1013]|uniref:Lrp/AsnC ligand binding domain-containing protein n=1 Tax=Falsirhodobacter sp. 1013 TaxID=3417566 RepID=UPI003EBD0B5E
MRNHPAIWCCHATTAAGDYLLHVIAADVNALDRLMRQEIARMSGVARTESVVATRVIKARQSLANAAKALRP